MSNNYISIDKIKCLVCGKKYLPVKLFNHKCVCQFCGVHILPEEIKDHLKITCLMNESYDESNYDTKKN